MKPYNLATGETITLPSPKERYTARLARMRHIIWLSVKTMQRCAIEDHARLIMYTLTYRGIKDWRPLHVSKFCKWLRRHGGYLYMWVGELQDRGAVHYHILALLPVGVKWVKPSALHGGWVRGFTWVTDEIKRPLYIMKYLQKGYRNGTIPRFPKGFRLYSVSRRLVSRMSFEHACSYRDAQVPRWLWSGEGDLWRHRCAYRARGGIVVGRQAVSSIYSTVPLLDVDKVKRKMYASWQGVGLLPQR